MLNETCSPEACRTPRAVDMAEAILTMDSVTARLEETVMKLTGAVRPGGEDKIPNTGVSDPCLNEVLNAGPDRIRQKTSLMHDLIAQIEEIVF